MDERRRFGRTLGAHRELVSREGGTPGILFRLRLRWKHTEREAEGVRPWGRLRAPRTADPLPAKVGR